MEPGPGASPSVFRATSYALIAGPAEPAWSLPYYVLAAGWIIGVPFLAQGAMRAGAIGLRPAILLGAGAVAVGLEGVFADNAYFIASSALLLIGGIDAAMSLFKASSEVSQEAKG